LVAAAHKTVVTAATELETCNLKLERTHLPRNVGTVPSFVADIIMALDELNGI
jgi:hypothetical protein